MSLYTPLPIQSFNCLRYGHSKADCKFKTSCIRCGGHDHIAKNCTRKLRCVNCSGLHASYDRSCIIRRAEMNKKMELAETRLIETVKVSHPDVEIVQLESATPAASGGTCTGAALYSDIAKRAVVRKLTPTVAMVFLPKPRELKVPPVKPKVTKQKTEKKSKVATNEKKVEVVQSETSAQPRSLSDCASMILDYLVRAFPQYENELQVLRNLLGKIEMLLPLIKSCLQ